MASRRKPSKKRNPNRIDVHAKPEENEAVVVARTVLRPSVQAALTLEEYGKSLVDLELSGLIAALTEQTDAAIGGDLGRAEAMLTAQAHTLDAIFNKLARLAIQMDFVDQLECFLKLALRAQSQSRATWETLSAIKNPPMAGYVRQANIAHGHQQVNNAPATANDGSRARETKNRQSKLLEAQDGERLDTSATRTTIGADSDMAPVGEINRPKNAPG